MDVRNAEIYSDFVIFAKAAAAAVVVAVADEADVDEGGLAEVVEEVAVASYGVASEGVV